MSNNDNVVSGVRAVNALLSGFRHNEESDNDSRDNSQSERFIEDPMRFETIQHRTNSYHEDHNARFVDHLGQPRFVDTITYNTIHSAADAQGTSRVADAVLHAKA